MSEKDYDKLKQIEIAIEQFDSKRLYESSLELLNALDYYSSKSARIQPNTFEGFLNNFNIPNSTINKDKALSSHWKQMEFIFQISDSEITRVQSIFDTGEVDRNEYQSFLFFAIKLKDESYKRSDLVKITREVNLPFKMPVIVLFQYGNKLTLSIIDRRLHKKDTSKDVLEKVTLIKDIDISNPQRAHKEILKDLSLNELYKKFEFHSFVQLHEAWKKTLNISELNRKFYKELAYWYFWAVQKVEYPDDFKYDKDKSKARLIRNSTNVIRLLTRLIFIWFLKEKNLVPEELFNKKDIDSIIDYKDKTGSTYYKAILQNLFFATLNTEMNKDVKDKDKISRTFVKRNTGVPHYFRYSRFIKDQNKFSSLMNDIPFLNGGLFECLDKRFKDSSQDIFVDGFTQQIKKEYLVTVPDYLFFTEAPQQIDLNDTFHTKGKKYEVRGLIDILNRYKFTIEENTPVEEEVALDPELLGKVFENLLASYNEETETTARKLTGSFYTPREIVNYMVDESLISWLNKSLLQEGYRENLIERLKQLFSYTGDPHHFNNKEIDHLIEAIDSCKILDPACGSGAFPMGILHKIVFVLNKLDPNNKKWKQKQLDKAKRDKTRAEQDFEDDRNRETSLNEISKRIQDIEKAFDTNTHELDYARKLYLIENCIYGVDVQPVAIQISKLRFFIALIVDQKAGNANQQYNRGIRPLPNLETKFVAANTLVTIEKPDQLMLTNFELEKQIGGKETEIHKVRERHFRARTPDTKEKYRLFDQQLRDELKILLEKAGFKKDETDILAKWNPYDQNTSANFFDPQWMFEINHGFDIVISNPPYRKLTRNNTDQNILSYYLERYKSIRNSDSKNLFTLFIERGVQLTNDKRGILSFIVPEGLFQTRSYENCVNIMKSNGSIEKIVTFSEFVFENAVTGNLIFVMSRPNSEEQTIFFHFDKDFNLSELEKNDVNLTKAIRDSSDWTLKEIAGVFKGIVVKDRQNVISSSKKGKKDSFLLGRNISKWQINSYFYTNFDDLVAIGGTKAKWKHDISPRILVRRTGDSLCCAFLNKKSITESTLYSVWSINKNIDNKFLYALLNSKCLDYYLRKNMITNKQAFPQVLMTDLELLPIINSTNQTLFITLIEFIEYLIQDNVNESIREKNDHIKNYFIEVLNGCVYELYFEEVMKNAKVNILNLIEEDLNSVQSLESEEAINILFKKWQEPKSEVRNRLLLMPTRCPDTLGVIESYL